MGLRTSALAWKGLMVVIPGMIRHAIKCLLFSDCSTKHITFKNKFSSLPLVATRGQIHKGIQASNCNFRFLNLSFRFSKLLLRCHLNLQPPKFPLIKRKSQWHLHICLHACILQPQARHLEVGASLRPRLRCRSSSQRQDHTPLLSISYWLSQVAFHYMCWLLWTPFLGICLSPCIVQGTWAPNSGFVDPTLFQ